MDKETAQYIVRFHDALLTMKEQQGIRHHSSTVKLQDREDGRKAYKKVGWLSDNSGVLQLLKDGYDHFLIETAKRIMSEHPDKVHLNHCPKCGRLARTPKSRQCRYCLHDWH